MRILGLIIAYLAAKNSIQTKNPRPYGRGYIFYMNCSKYFSLNPASGNLKSFCVPSIAV